MLVLDQFVMHHNNERIAMYLFLLRSEVYIHVFNWFVPIGHTSDHKMYFCLQDSKDFTDHILIFSRYTKNVAYRLNLSSIECVLLFNFDKDRAVHFLVALWEDNCLKPP